jgi:hypothetical protein
MRVSHATGKPQPYRIADLSRDFTILDASIGIVAACRHGDLLKR